MSNNKAFKIKNGLLAGRYLGSNGTETAGSVGYYLTGASYDSKSFSTATQGSPISVAFKSDGTAMYILTTSPDSVFQYTLSTAWDVSTASYASKSFSVSSQGTGGIGITFKPDGTKMYLAEATTNDSLFEYDLSTAWDISTASYNSVSLSVSSQDTSPLSVTFNDDGTKLYVAGNTNDSIFQYSLTTAYDLSTASYDSVSLDVSAQGTNPRTAVFNADGTKMFIPDDSQDAIFQYSLSTGFDLSTASYDSFSFDVSSQATGLWGTSFSADGTKLYITDSVTNSVYQYSSASYTQTLDLSTGNTFSFTPSGATTVSFTNPPASGLAIGFTLEVVNTGGYTLTWPSSIKWHGGTTPTATATKEVYAFITTDGGTTYYGKKAGENIT